MVLLVNIEFRLRLGNSLTKAHSKFILVLTRRIQNSIFTRSNHNTMVNQIKKSFNWFWNIFEYIIINVERTLLSSTASVSAHHASNDAIQIVYCSFCERLWSVLYPPLLVAGVIGNAAFCVTIKHLSHGLRSTTRLILYLLALLDSATLLLGFVTRCAGPKLQLGPGEPLPPPPPIGWPPPTTFAKILYVVVNPIKLLSIHILHSQQTLGK